MQSNTTTALRRGSKRNRGGTSTAAAVSGMTTRSKGREEQQSLRSRSARDELDGTGERLPSEGRRKRKRAKVDGTSRRVSSERSSKNGKRRQGEEEEEHDGSCSSAASSPLREPCMPDGAGISEPIDSEISKKYREMQEEYYAKIGLRFKPLALRHSFFTHHIYHLTNRRGYCYIILKSNNRNLQKKNYKFQDNAIPPS